MRERIDLTGQRFDKLIVLHEGETRRSRNGNSVRTWICQCECGNTIRVDTSNLTSGHTHRCRECGIQSTANRRRKHGETRTKLYRTWSDMLTRCNNPNSTNFKKYGAKGIKVCDEWQGKNGYIHFREWAYANGYDPETASRTECTLDRIDFTSGYSPDNCRWASSKVQCNNYSRNVFVTDTDGEALTLMQLAEKYDINYGTILARYRRGVRDIEKLKETSIKGAGIKRVTHFGERKYYKRKIS